MYEDNEQSVLRRILLIALWLIIITTIAWAGIWLAFFRNNSPPQSGNTHHTQHSQSSSATTSKTQSSSSGSNTGAGNTGVSTNTTTPPTSSSTTTHTPSTLANTGAGDVFLPFAIGTVTGSMLYYMHLRKKLIE